MSVINIDDPEYFDKLLDYTKDIKYTTVLNSCTGGLLVAYFRDRTNIDCKKLDRKFEDYANSPVLIGSVFCTINNDVCHELCERYKVGYYPIIVFFKNGLEVDRTIGLQIDDIRAKIQKYA